MDETLETLEIQVKYRASSAAAAIQKTTKAVKSLSQETKKAQTPLSNFIASLKRIAFYRFIRSVIKSITTAFKEGLEWAYLFSSGITTEGHRFSKALDSMKTATTTMKAQLGAAFAGLLTAITPVILQIIDLVTKLADVISQVFAAFTGGTYLKAVDTPQKWADGAKNAGKAAKEWKNQLMGFDEINKLTEPSGGSGSTSTIDPSKMFEDTPINPKILEIVDKLKEGIQWIKDHLDIILPIVEAIGIAFLAWGLADKVTSLLGLETPLKTILGIVMAVAGAFLLVKGWIDAITNGVSWDNLTTMLLGVALVVGGLAIAFGIVGAAIGLLVGGVLLLIAGIKDFIKTGELTPQAFAAIEAGILLIGVALSLLTGNIIPLVIAAVVGLVFAIVTHWDEIKQWTKDTWEKIKTWTIETWEKIKEKAAEIWGKIKDKTVEIWGKIKAFFTETIPKINDEIVNWLKELPGKIAYWLGVIIGKFAAWSDNAHQWVIDEVPKIIDSVVEWFKGLPDKIGTALANFAVTIAVWALDAIKWVNENVPSVLNSVTDWFEKLPDALKNIGKNMIYGLWNGIISVGTWLYNKISSFFGGAWDIVKDVFGSFGKGVQAGYESVKKFATGGFPSEGSLFIANEAGPEMVGTIGGRTAVATNDQIIEGVRQGVFEAVSAAMGNNNDRNVSVKVFLDSKEIRAGQQRLARAMGGVI